MNILSLSLSVYVIYFIGEDSHLTLNSETPSYKHPVQRTGISPLSDSVIIKWHFINIAVYVEIQEINISIDTSINVRRYLHWIDDVKLVLYNKKLSDSDILSME